MKTDAFAFNAFNVLCALCNPVCLRVCVCVCLCVGVTKTAIASEVDYSLVSSDIDRDTK